MSWTSPTTSCSSSVTRFTPSTTTRPRPSYRRPPCKSRRKNQHARRGRTHLGRQSSVGRLTAMARAPSASAASWAEPTPKSPSPRKMSSSNAPGSNPSLFAAPRASLKLHTEASTRFGRGADPEIAEVASRRAAELILQLAGGELLSGVVDVYPGKRAPKKIHLTRTEFLRVMGADVPDKEIESILAPSDSLPFASAKIAARKAPCSPPGNARNPLGAPKSNAKSISSKKSRASTASTISRRACPPPARARNASPQLRTRAPPPRTPHRSRLSRNPHHSSRCRRTRRTLPPRRCRARAPRKSALRRSQRPPFERRSHHGRRP